MTNAPAGPGWWRASDGRWYPPQQPAPPPPAARKSHRGIWIAVTAIVVLFLVAGGLGAYWAYRKVSDTVSSVTGGAGLNCPTSDDVGGLIGSPVAGPTGGNMVVASGCYYTGDVFDVIVVSGAKLVADDQIASMVGEGEAAGAEVHPIDVGSKGRAWASDNKSSAIAVGPDALVSVEVQGKDFATIPDKTDAAVAILRKVLH
jgi:hypothetical protein